MTHADWNGYEQLLFAVDGRESFVVCPKKAVPGNPWVWRVEFFGAFDTADRALLEQGWHLAYHCVSNMYGCPQAIAWMHDFQREVEQEISLSPTPVLFGFSRGGLYAFHYARTYPDQVAALYLDAPVLDIRSWPGAKGASPSKNEALWLECMECYGLTEESAQAFHGNPLDYAEELAATGMPILIVAGLADKTVPYAENGAILRDRYARAGGEIHAIEKYGCDHHPHSLEDPAPIVSWILAHLQKKRPVSCSKMQ